MKEDTINKIALYDNSSFDSDNTKKYSLCPKNLNDNEELFKKIFNKSPNSITIVDHNGIILEANDEAINSIGVNPIGKTHLEIFPKEIAERRVNIIKKSIDRSTEIKYYDRRDNRYFLKTLIPLDYYGDKCCMVISDDLTEIYRLNKLLSTINNIIQTILFEKGQHRLLEKICHQLSQIKENYSVWIGLLVDDYILPVAESNANIFFSTNEEILERIIRIDLNDLDKENCILNAIKNKKAEITNPLKPHEKCPLKCKNIKSNNVILPMIFNKEVLGIIFINCSENGLSEDEIDLLQNLANNLAYAIKFIENEEIKRKSIDQLGENILNFAYLVDRIRNPLAVISVLSQIRLNDDNLRGKILNQIQRIDSIIYDLDKAWGDSEKIKNYVNNRKIEKIL